MGIMFVGGGGNGGGVCGGGVTLMKRLFSLKYKKKFTQTFIVV